MAWAAVKAAPCLSMPLKYLYGPVDPAYAEDNLYAARAAGECLAFNPQGNLDLAIGLPDGWEQVLQRLPAGWTPDFIALFLPFTAIPDCLWRAPVPLVGLAGDWHLLWHQYRFALPVCDLVVTDAAGVEAFEQAGIRAVAGNLYGCARSFLADGGPQRRDIDVLYVGSLHPAEQRGRLPWLRRAVLAAGERSNVVIRTDAGRCEYLDLLRRSRILFNRSVRGECNLRAFEAAASGALLFQEAENREVRRYLRDRAECVFYGGETLEPLLQHYLADEADRSRIAAAAKRRAREFTFARLWQTIVNEVEIRMEDLKRRAATRSDGAGGMLPAGRSWESLDSSTRAWQGSALERMLIDDLHQRMAGTARPELYNMLGLALARRAQREGAFNGACAADVAAQFRRAVELAPGSALFRLNLAEALWRTGSEPEAAGECRRALASLDRADLNEADLTGGHFPPAFDTFRVEWERAAWNHPSDRKREAQAKIRLLEWRLHSLLGALTGDLGHYRCAARLRDDLWTSHAALGRALLRAAGYEEAAVHLQCACELNPFDDSLAGDLLCALRAAGDFEGERRFAAERQLLRRAAAMNPPAEIRFAQEVTAAS
jgi:tetratricopeptide (TPR) repeat protein